MARRRGYKRYSAEFKREALKRASEDEMTDKVVCKELGISSRQLGCWRDELRLPGDNAFLGKGGRSAAEEVIRLKRELAKVKQERAGITPVMLFMSNRTRHMVFAPPGKASWFITYGRQVICVSNRNSGD